VAVGIYPGSFITTQGQGFPDDGFNINAANCYQVNDGRGLPDCVIQAGIGFF